MLHTCQNLESSAILTFPLIPFLPLFLRQDRGCQDFDGMCCMNLSDHSESIHKSVQDLQNRVKKLQVDDGWNIFGVLFRGLAGWIKNLLKTVSLSHCFSLFSDLCSMLIAVYTENDTKCYEPYFFLLIKKGKMWVKM